MKIIRISISFLLVLLVILSFSGCIRIVPKSSSSTATSESPASSTTDESDWVINDDDDEPPFTEPADNGDQDSDTPGTVKSGTGQTTFTGTPSSCDLVIQPDTLNAPPGVYTFTASSSSYNNAQYIWDINGTPYQYGPQSTFSADLNSTGTGTISVTLVVDGIEICTATSFIIITASQQVQCDLQIYPATLNNVTGNYTFTATTSNQNALFVWDINGSPQQYGPERTFTVYFNDAGTGTISVTMIVDGNEVCTATSYVTITRPIIIN
jgi:hypothetical protein